MKNGMALLNSLQNCACGQWLSPFDLGIVDVEPPCGCATADSHLLYYLFLIIRIVLPHIVVNCVHFVMSSALERQNSEFPIRVNSMTQSAH